MREVLRAQHGLAGAQRPYDGARLKLDPTSLPCVALDITAGVPIQIAQPSVALHVTAYAGEALYGASLASAHDHAVVQLSRGRHDADGLFRLRALSRAAKAYVHLIRGGAVHTQDDLFVEGRG